MLTLLGLDNFAVAAGWVGIDFACVGEWFLGSILFLYLLFPLLQRALRRNIWLTWASPLAVCIPIHLLGWDARLVAVHIPEFLFGMTFLIMPKRAQLSCLRRCWQELPPPAALTARSPAHSPVPLFLSCWRWRPRCWTARGRVLLARNWQKSYAVFLVHHVLIQDMAAHFDLAALSRRGYGIFVCGLSGRCVCGGGALLWLQKTLRRAFAAPAPCLILCLPVVLQKNSGYFFAVFARGPLYQKTASTV